MLAIKVPPLGESVVEATVSRWAKAPGDGIAAGETIVELETDKVTVEVPALKPGVLVSQAKQVGDIVKVDDLLGEVDETAVPAAAPAKVAAAAAPATSPAAPTTAAPVTAGGRPPAAPPSRAPTPTGVPVTPATGVRASPAAQVLAQREGVDLNAVSGTGRGGVVSKSDVLDHLARPAESRAPAATPSASSSALISNGARVAAPADGPRENREKMTTRRKRIAENLVQAQHATAHLTTFNEIDMSAVSALRDRLRERVERDHGVRLSFMPFFVKAACLALQQYPIVNAQIDGDSIVYRRYVNMGIAVASDQGLVVPVIRDADRKGAIEIAREIQELAGRARSNKLTIDDLTGGTFSITNGGVFGSLVSTPILNYPQSGILGLHKVQDRPVAVQGQVVIRPMMYVALSYDHRIIDGQQAVLFLVRVKELMEDPASMLVA
jgi:2-oxoglutarate dehydrogenase E2 component (dihydrolipoamide succinyltransferase)